MTTPVSFSLQNRIGIIKQGTGFYKTRLELQHEPIITERALTPTLLTANLKVNPFDRTFLGEKIRTYVQEQPFGVKRRVRKCLDPVQ